MGCQKRKGEWYGLLRGMEGWMDGVLRLALQDLYVAVYC